MAIKKANRREQAGGQRKNEAMTQSISLYDSLPAAPCQTTPELSLDEQLAQAARRVETALSRIITPRPPNVLSVSQEWRLRFIRDRGGYEPFRALKIQAGVDPAVPICRLSGREAWPMIHIHTTNQGARQ